MRVLASLPSLVVVLSCVFQESLWAAPAEPPRPQAELFRRDRPQVLRLHLQIAPDGLARLQANPREYVHAIVEEVGGRRYPAGVHLKGRTGSFRSLDGKPSFTLAFDREQRFHDLSKVHLNNSVEDPSFLHELLGSDLFNAAGVPAPRVAHAVVELNGQSLGLYVLKEGFTEEFVRQPFPEHAGRLYEPADGAEIDGTMEEKFVVGQPAVRVLESIRLVTRDPAGAGLQSWFEQSIDRERFVTFVALEVLLGHRDGYSIARNNFRIWEDDQTGRLVFLPHGMDQIFGSAPSLLEPHMGGLLAQVLMRTPQGRAQYRAQLGSLLTHVFDPSKLNQRIDVVAPSLRAAIPRKAAHQLDEAVLDLKARITRRHGQMQGLIHQPELRPLSFVDGVARLTGWQKHDVPTGGAMPEVLQGGELAELQIQAGPRTSASWRALVRLAPGRYRFEGVAEVRGFRPLGYGRSNGAFLRAWTQPPIRSPEAQSGPPGTPLALEFTLAEEATVTLACEFRGAAGVVSFAGSTLRVVRMPADE